MKSWQATAAFLFALTALSASEKPWVDLASLKALVAAHQAATDALRDHYIVIATGTISGTDAKGNCLNKIRDYEVIVAWQNGTTLSKTLATNGGRVDPKQEALEESILLRDIKSLEEKGKVQNGSPSVSEYLASCEVRILGQETLAGRPAIRLALSPGKPSDALNTLAVYASSLKGEMYLDAANGQLIKLETEFVKDYFFNFDKRMHIKKGATNRTENQWVNGEIWLPAKNLHRDPTGSIFARTYIQNASEVKICKQAEVSASAFGTPARSN